MRASARVAALFEFLLAISCSSTRSLKPLGAKSVAADVAITSAWLQYQRAFPVATVVTGLRYGLTDNADLSFRVEPLLLAKGIVAAELGSTCHLTQARGLVPALHASPSVSVMSSPAHVDDGFSEGFRAAVAVDAIAHWEPHHRVWPYLVVQNAWIFASHNHVASVSTGATVFLTSRWEASAEFGIAGFTERSNDYTQPYIGVGGHGALSTSGSVTYRW